MAILIAILRNGQCLSTTLAIAATCRDVTDLDKLTARLVEVVDETMQPESVSLWLKDFNAKPALSAAEGPQRGNPRQAGAGDAKE